jgi:Flp pilus assembly protein TadD
MKSGWLWLLAAGLCACQGIARTPTPVPTPSAQRVAEIAIANQDYRGAIEALTSAIVEEPDDAYLYYLRGLAYYSGYKLAYDAQPSSADARDISRAISDFTKALELNSNYAEAYNYRGVAYSTLGDHEHALADYNAAIKLQPDEATPYYGRGYVYEQMGQKDLAAADYRRFLELSQDTFWRGEAEKRLRALEGQPR